ncbi:MAG: HAD family hydrolase [Chloroflexi bacterium]|nr:HAD family hydrolase [Chloroflexota bacterium]
MLDSSRIRAILFDMDGTLADTDDEFIARVAGLVRPLGFAFPRRDPTLFLRWGLTRVETPLNYLLTVPDQLHIDRPLARAIDSLNRLRGHGAPASFLLIAGVHPLLQTLSARYPLALVSSRDRRGVEAFLDQFELRPYFGVVVTALSAPRIKPHPAPVLFAARALGLPAEHCVMVGDTTVDVYAGKRAGAQTAGVLCGFGQRDELERAGADAVVERTPDVAGLLAG